MRLGFSLVAIQDSEELVARLLNPALLKGFNPQPDPPGSPVFVHPEPR
jgi:hypothetical protein